MRIVRSTRTKACVDGSLMKEYVLDEPLSDGFLQFLNHFGVVRFLHHLEKPYFSFEKEHFISIKGFVGDEIVEVRYKKTAQDLVMDFFHLLLFYERQGEAGIRKLKGIEGSISDKMKVRMDAADRERG